jgi:hypothetical protein
MRKRFEGRHSLKTDIKMDLGEEWFQGADWHEVARDRVHLCAFMNMVMNLVFHKSHCKLFKEEPITLSDLVG